jgi:LPXTG-motif cell wall-anchored protein
VLPIGIEALILVGFGIVLLGAGVVNFRRRN